jgi:uroporphyrinogen-III decarboxylase
LNSLISPSQYGKFLLSSGCAVGRDTPPENIDAIADAVRAATGVQFGSRSV